MPTCGAETKRGTLCSRSVHNAWERCGLHTHVAPAYSRETVEDLQSTDQERICIALQHISIITGESAVRAFLNACLLPRVLQLAFTGETEMIKDRAYTVLTNLASLEDDLGARAIWQATPETPDNFENALQYTFDFNQ